MDESPHSPQFYRQGRVYLLSHHQLAESLIARTSPVESLYVEANEESLYRRRERLSLQYAIKLSGGRRSPVVACWASDHWVAGSNPLRGSFVINFASLSPASAWPSLA